MFDGLFSLLITCGYLRPYLRNEFCMHFCSWKVVFKPKAKQNLLTPAVSLFYNLHYITRTEVAYFSEMYYRIIIKHFCHSHLIMSCVRHIVVTYGLWGIYEICVIQNTTLFGQQGLSAYKSDMFWSTHTHIYIYIWHSRAHNSKNTHWGRQCTGSRLKVLLLFLTTGWHVKTGEIKRRGFMTPPFDVMIIPKLRDVQSDSTPRKKERRLQRYDVQMSDWNIDFSCLGYEVQPFPVPIPRKSNWFSSSQLFHSWLCLCQTFK